MLVSELLYIDGLFSARVKKKGVILQPLRSVWGEPLSLWLFPLVCLLWLIVTDIPIKLPLCLNKKCGKKQLYRSHMNLTWFLPVFMTEARLLPVSGAACALSLVKHDTMILINLKLLCIMLSLNAEFGQWPQFLLTLRCKHWKFPEIEGTLCFHI